VAVQVDPAISEQLIARGALAYVEKPFTMERLDAVIRAALAGPPAPRTPDRAPART